MKKKIRKTFNSFKRSQSLIYGFVSHQCLLSWESQDFCKEKVVMKPPELFWARRWSEHKTYYILFFFLSLLFGALCDNPPVRHLLASRSRFSVSASGEMDTNSSMNLLGGLGQGRLGGPVTTKAICQACNGLRVQQPFLCSDLSPLSVPWERNCADCTAGPRLGLYRQDRDTPRQVKQE